MRSVFLCSALSCLISIVPVLANQDSIITVIAGAETHAMLESCDCPSDPGGGLMKRSSIVGMISDRSKLLLLDAGGFAGGGIYDSYSEGRAADSLRTILTIKGMGKIGYDAVAIGDEELQYGGAWIVKIAKDANVPLVSANCFSKTGKNLVAPYVLVKKAGVTFGVTAVTTIEKIIATDTTVRIKDPVASLRQIWSEMSSKSDYQIILSHLGQQESFELADSFPDCDLIVNGHRKSDQDPVAVNGNVPVMQFGFQGKSLSYAQLKLKANKSKLLTSKWLFVNPTIPDDSTLIPFLTAKPVESKPVYDLYIMSQCPYGLQALNGFVEFVKTFKDADWNINFIGTVDKDFSFNSLHGPEEVEDEMIWLAVKELHPKKWIEFLQIRSKEYIPTRAILQKMKIDVEKINQWIALKGKEVLAGHYQRSVRLNINASPTLLINNVPAKVQITGQQLAKLQCEKTDNQSPVCKTLPECLNDSDCKSKGKIGRCGETGKCIFQDAVPFNFTVLVADSAFQQPEQAVIATTEELFPGVNVQIVKFSSEQGQKLYKKYNPQSLPFYIFSREVRQAHNFTSIESGLSEKNGSLVFNDGIVIQNYLPGRTSQKGSTVLFIDPFFTQLPFIIDRIYSDSLLRVSTKIMPVIFQDPKETIRGTEAWFRMEEAQRWLLMNKLFENSYFKYLDEYRKTPGSSFWPDLCKRAAIETDSLMTKLKSDTTELKEHWKLLQNISIKDPLVILVDNRELVTIRNEKELERYLQERIR